MINFLRPLILPTILCLSLGMGTTAVAQSIQRPTLESFDQVTTRMPAITALQLTSEQQAQLLQIMSQAQVDLEAVMTEEQKLAFWSALNQGERVRDAVVTADLSFSQLWQLRPVMQDTQSQLEAVLTPEQQQQMESFQQANR